MQVVELLLVLQHARICLAELSLIEGIAELFLCLLYLFGNLVLIFRHLLLDEHVSAISLLGIPVVNEWVVECVNVT